MAKKKTTKKAAKPKSKVNEAETTLSLPCVNVYLKALKLAVKAASLVSGVHVRHKCWQDNTNLKAEVTDNAKSKWKILSIYR